MFFESSVQPSYIFHLSHFDFSTETSLGVGGIFVSIKWVIGASGMSKKNVDTSKSIWKALALAFGARFNSFLAVALKAPVKTTGEYQNGQ